MTNVKRSYLIVSCHGERPKDFGLDTITSGAVKKLYERSNSAFSSVPREELAEDRTFLRYSGAERTLLTGEALLGGVFNVEPQGLSVRVKTDIDRNLNPDGLLIDREILNRDPDRYNAWIIENLRATTFENRNIPITPIAEVMQQRRPALSAPLKSLLSGYSLGTVVSHRGLTDVFIKMLIDTGRSSPLQKLEDIGGVAAMNDFAVISMDYRDPNTISHSEMKYHGDTYKLDLQRLI